MHRRKRHHPIIHAFEIALVAFCTLWGICAWQAANASASVAHTSGETVFCNAFATFGDTSNFHNLTVAHRDAKSANAKTHRAYNAFENALLQGRPRTTLRTDLARVYTDCGA